MECRRARSSDRNSVRLSVCLSNASIVTKRKKDICPDFYTIRKIINPEREMVGVDDPFYLTFRVNRPRWNEIADFKPVIVRSASAVTPSEKSSLNTTTKSTRLVVWRSG